MLSLADSISRLSASISQLKNLFEVQPHVPSSTVVDARDDRVATKHERAEPEPTAPDPSHETVDLLQTESIILMETCDENLSTRTEEVEPQSTSLPEKAICLEIDEVVINQATEIGETIDGMDLMINESPALDLGPPANDIADAETATEAPSSPLRNMGDIEAIDASSESLSQVKTVARKKKRK